MNDIDTLARYVFQSTAERNRLYFRVLLNDERCPELCCLLEKIGYRFSGILPEAGEGDYIIYSRYCGAELARLSLYSKRAKAFRRYLQNETRIDQVRVFPSGSPRE